MYAYECLLMLIHIQVTNSTIFTLTMVLDFSHHSRQLTTILFSYILLNDTNVLPFRYDLDVYEKWPSGALLGVPGGLTVDRREPRPGEVEEDKKKNKKSAGQEDGDDKLIGMDRVFVSIPVRVVEEYYL